MAAADVHLQKVTEAPALNKAVEVQEARQKELKEAKTQELIKKAAERLPDVEVKYCLDFFKANAPEVPAKADAEIRDFLVRNRWMNRVCNQCGRGGSLHLLCISCWCTWWCSPKCAYDNLELHQAWCNKRDAAARDAGPMGTKIVKIG